MKSKSKLDLQKILEAQRKFVKAREWDDFHTPKNLTMALSGEAAELMEIFQWLSQEESLTVHKDKDRREMISDELADIFFYLLRVCDKLDIDIEKAFWSKMKKNSRKYPVRLARGNAKKYYELKQKNRAASQ